MVGGKCCLFFSVPGLCAAYNLNQEGYRRSNGMTLVGNQPAVLFLSVCLWCWLLDFLCPFEVFRVPVRHAHFCFPAFTRWHHVEFVKETPWLMTTYEFGVVWFAEACVLLPGSGTS